MTIGRTTKILASGYQRDRAHAIRLMPTEIRPLQVDISAAVDPARTIASARFQIDVAGTATLSGGAISGKVASCLISGWRSGWVGGRCVITLDDGQKVAQHFVVTVTATDFDTDAEPAGSLEVNVTP